MQDHTRRYVVGIEYIVWEEKCMAAISAALSMLWRRPPFDNKFGTCRPLLKGIFSPQIETCLKFLVAVFVCLEWWKKKMFVVSLGHFLDKHWCFKALTRPLRWLPAPSFPSRRETGPIKVDTNSHTRRGVRSRLLGGRNSFPPPLFPRPYKFIQLLLPSSPQFSLVFSFEVR